jgi:hypothetical protein
MADKRLRALLVRCPEWNDAGERARLADAVQAEDAAAGVESGVPALLRSRSGAGMRKKHMLRLAYCWRYSSDCWSRKRGDGAPERKRRPAPAPGPAATTPSTSAADSGASAQRAQLALLPPHGASAAAAAADSALRDRTLQTAGAAEAQVMSSLIPLIRGATAAWEGPASLVAYGRVRGAGMTWRRVRSIHGALEVTHWLDAVVSLRLRALRAWRDTLGEEDQRAPAYTVDAAYHSPESELEAMRYILVHSSASTHIAAAAAALPDGSLTAQDAAWVCDFRAGHAAALGLVATGLAFVAQQRMEPLRSYLDAAEAVLVGMQRYFADSGAALGRRMVWTSATCEALGAAAGDREAANACMPPLVERLRLTRDDPNGARLLAMATTPLPRGEPPPRFALSTQTDSGLSGAAAALLRRLPPLHVPMAWPQAMQPVPHAQLQRA